MGKRARGSAEGNSADVDDGTSEGKKPRTEANSNEHSEAGKLFLPLCMLLINSINPPQTPESLQQKLESMRDDLRAQRTQRRMELRRVEKKVLRVEEMLEELNREEHTLSEAKERVDKTRARAAVILSPCLASQADSKK